MWKDLFPSFLIGTREGLEAGLVVSILVATLVRSDQKSRLPQVWTGVLAAVTLSLSFGAVLTFTAANLSATAQEAFGGTLSVIAVAFVTAMVFWMRRNARTLSGEIRSKVDAALAVGSGMLVATSFLAVGREGLETALFIWTTAQSATESTGPLVGAAVGLVLAAVLCWALYRRVLTINLAKFFTWTGIGLIVVAAGVLAYGLRDLQEGGVLPGGSSFAVDLSGSIDANSWYATLIQGVFNLTTRMTWLQAVAYLVYLGIVMTLFVRGVRAPRAVAVPKDAPVPTAAAAASETVLPEAVLPEPVAPEVAVRAGASGSDAVVAAAEAVVSAAEAVVSAAAAAGAAAAAAQAAAASTLVPASVVAGGRDTADASATAPVAAAMRKDRLGLRRLIPSAAPPVTAATTATGTANATAPEPDPEHRGRPRWLVPTAAVAVPAVIASVIIGASGGKPAAAATVTVSQSACGQGFAPPKPGQQVFQMRNTGNQTSEVYLVDPTTNAVYGEVEGIAPGTTRALTATLGSGDYAWRCVSTSGSAVTSATVHVSGGTTVAAVLPLAATDLDAPLAQYKAYVGAGLAALLPATRRIATDLHAGKLAEARTDWLTAHLQYAALGAAYGTFGDFDAKINGRADGLPLGVKDPGFTGFRRLEYGLWHGESAAGLAVVANTLVTDVAGLGKAFPSQDFDPTDLPLRTHEILENTLQFELTTDTDEGSGTNLATAAANLTGTRELLTVLRPLISRRDQALLTTVDGDLGRVAALLAAQHTAAGWTPLEQLDTTARQSIDGAVGQLLEDLSPVPDLLEIRKSA
ncbi:iron uptake transporter permease EfeU [Streptacidiphilus jeojiense]|uniref:iron uptake transporter permease EfeU n=1 Tax=Streptacidiphilus jeojiense TaxID=436229 RepID=UPI0004C005D9|nr:iron uptake transporter permease EfeU [Streptacidiphilus jeojiense]